MKILVTGTAGFITSDTPSRRVKTWATWANVDDLIEDIGYSPNVPIGEGVKEFVEWYLDF